MKESKLQKVKKFARDERTLEILEAVAKLGVIVFLGVFTPNAAGHIIKMLGWVPDSKNKYRTGRTLSSLERKKFIKFWIKDGKGRIALTKEGKLYFASLKVKRVKLPSKGKWDGLWRIVTFDIPERLKANRKRFSRALVFAGMYNLEESVFVYPHECKDQIFKIADLYDVKKHICYIVARSVEPDVKLIREFPFTRRPISS